MPNLWKANTDKALKWCSNKYKMLKLHKILASASPPLITTAPRSPSLQFYQYSPSTICIGNDIVYIIFADFSPLSNSLNPYWRPPPPEKLKVCHSNISFYFLSWGINYYPSSPAFVLFNLANLSDISCMSEIWELLTSLLEITNLIDFRRLVFRVKFINIIYKLFARNGTSN